MKVWWFVALALVHHIAPASAGAGFSALTEHDGLFVFDSLDALKSFTPTRVLPLPLAGGPAVSAAADEAKGHFIVLGTTAVAALDASGAFKQTYNFSSFLQFFDIAFTGTGSALALGGEPAPLFQRAIFASTADGGFTWNISSSIIDGQTGGHTGRLAFSGNNGVMTMGAYIAASSNSGLTWSSVQGYPMKYLSLALNQRVSIVAGNDFTGGTFASLTTDLWQSLEMLELPREFDRITGIAIASHQEFVLTTYYGQIWRTTNGGQNWEKVYFAWGVVWADLTWSAALKVYLAVGRNNDQSQNAVLAYSTDGLAWSVSPAFKALGFVRAVPAVPSAPSTSPSASPSVLPSSSPSPSPSPVVPRPALPRYFYVQGEVACLDGPGVSCSGMPQAQIHAWYQFNENGLLDQYREDSIAWDPTPGAKQGVVYNREYANLTHTTHFVLVDDTSSALACYRTPFGFFNFTRDFLLTAKYVGISEPTGRLSRGRKAHTFLAQWTANQMPIDVITWVLVDEPDRIWGYQFFPLVYMMYHFNDMGPKGFNPTPFQRPMGVGPCTGVSTLPSYHV